MRAFGAMAVSGVVGLLIVKVMMALMMPMLAAAFGVLMLVVKWGAIIGLGYLVWSFIRGRRKEAEVS